MRSVKIFSYSIPVSKLFLSSFFLLNGLSCVFFFEIVTIQHSVGKMFLRDVIFSHHYNLYIIIVIHYSCITNFNAHVFILASDTI